MNFIGEYEVPAEAVEGANAFFEQNSHLATVGQCGKHGVGYVVDPDTKDSIDLPVSRGETAHECLLPYFNSLGECLNRYKQEYRFCEYAQADWRIVEPPNIQHYPPGGGFKIWHYEKSGSASTINRHLVFMTYLTDVPPEHGGGTEFLYQQTTYQCRAGLTLIWPAEWTHTHRGVVSPTHEKRIMTGWYSYTNAKLGD